MAASFVHLRLHSEFSFIDGIVRVKPLVSTVAEAGMPAVAITDQSNLCALVKFYKAAMSAGVKPICGCDVLVERENPDDEPSAMVLLVQNKTGYLNLSELISQGYLEGQLRGRVILKREWIANLSEGLIALSGGKEGEVGKALLAGNNEDASRLLAYWITVFHDRFYLELQRTGRNQDEEYLHQAVKLAGHFNCPVVATNDVRFIKQSDFDAHETRVCIHDGRTLDDPRRPKKYSEQQYLRSAEEMVELFSDVPEAIENTVEIAKRCNLEMQLGKYFLPNYPIPEGMTLDEFFRKISKEGLENRLESILDKSDPSYAEKRKVYDDRLTFELDIIIQMGFPGYFLIVMDFIKWAKDNDVPVGPGRGSGAGSIVAYAQNITDLDPIHYDLLFERFLNPERVSMPDFDVDFCMDGRDRVIDYVAETYGRDAVSQIITFGTMAAKAVVRDVARVQGKPYSLADKLSKLIPFEVGITLNKAMEDEDALREFVEADEDASEIMDMAYKLEGITRNAGKHAGGVVIAPTKLTDFSPLYCDETGGNLVSQFDKDDVEQAGLVKFDFLGLRTLTIIDWAMKTINAKRAETQLEPLAIESIPLNDKKCFELLKRAETTAVFQLESRGMKDLVKRLQPDSLEEMIALVALFRPGPLQSGMVDDFINRKHGRAEVAYPDAKYQHECLKPILEPTYGVIVYQEQVMQIAQELAGYTLGGADLLRRAMGKKKPEEMAKQREAFESGAKEQGIDPDLAVKIFDLVEKFAGYGFNKSHSAAYALVSYQTLWLKTHYPSAFMAAVLSSDMQNTDKVVIFVEECRNMKLPLILPDVNSGDFKFTVNEQDEVVYGLGAIKGVGEGPVSSIVEARKEGGLFKDIFDFCHRVDARSINKRVMEALIRSGALDSIAPSRGVLAASMVEAMKTAEQSAKNLDSGIADMFGEVVPTADDDSDVYEVFKGASEWSDKERLKGEKDTLGLYLTGHPIDEYEKELRNFSRDCIQDLKPSKSSQLVAGLIVATRTMKSKRGDTIAFITLDDRTARIEVAIFADLYDSSKQYLGKDAVLIVDGVVSHDDYSGLLKMRGSKVMDISEARLGYAKCVEIQFDHQQLENDFSKQLAGVLAPYCVVADDNPYREEPTTVQGCLVKVVYRGPSAKANLRLSDDWLVKPSDELLQRLKGQYGNDAVSLLYA